jgi:hypothetical protein
MFSRGGEGASVGAPATKANKGEAGHVGQSVLHHLQHALPADALK